MVSQDPEILLEIERAITEATARFALAGHVEVTADSVTLRGNGPSVRVAMGGLASRWAGLTDDERARRATELARSLSTARRGAISTDDARGPRVQPALVAAFCLLLVVLGLGGTLLVRWVQHRNRGDDPAAVRAHQLDAYEAERLQRARRVCDATRSRVMRGAAVGPADVEGWVAELTFLGSPSDARRIPALEDFVRWSEGADSSPARLVWSGAPALTSESGPDTEVAFANGSLTGKRGPALSGLRVVFGGRYVVPFFHGTERTEYVRLAASLASSVGAKYGALYARCAHADDHHLGAWFYGPGPSGALTSLLYFMGTYADVSPIRQSALRPEDAPGDQPLDRAYAFEQLREVTASLDKQRISTLLAKQGGMISGAPDQPSAITFPFLDANRASRATRDVARALGIGSNR